MRKKQLGISLKGLIIGLGVLGFLAVMAAKRDPDFAPVLVRHLRQRGHLSC